METLGRARSFFSARAGGSLSFVQAFPVLCAALNAWAADLFSALCAGKAKNASNMKKPPGCPDGFLYPFGFI